MKKHWYYITVYECPVCAHSREVRTRMFSKKPKDANKRYKYVIDYDYCNV